MSGKSLFKVIDDFFILNGISFTNIVRFCSDGAASTTDKYNSVYTRLKRKCPYIFFLKCMSHTAHLIASKAYKVFPQLTAQFITKMPAYFGNSNKRLEDFQDFQSFFGLN